MDNGEKKKDSPLYAMFQGPGPVYRLRTCLGTKEHCPTLKQGPAYSIGHRYSEKVESKPGPIYWYDSKLTSHGKTHIPACHISGRPKAKSTTDLTPGPGDYDISKVREGVLSKEHRAPRILIGGRTQFREKSDAPPPNKYSVSMGMGSRSQTNSLAPAWSLRGRPDFGGSYYNTLKQATPGPANYSTVNNSTSKGFTIQGRTGLKDYKTIKDNPGPNQYNPSTLYNIGNNRKGFSMGIRHSKYIMPMLDVNPL